MKKAKRCKGKRMLMWKDLYNSQLFQAKPFRMTLARYKQLNDFEK